MADKVRIKFGSEVVEATPININQSNEYFNQYVLEDGTLIKMKLVATKAFRIDGRYDQEGNPVYFIRSTNVMSADASAHLKKGSS